MSSFSSIIELGGYVASAILAAVTAHKSRALSKRKKENARLKDNLYGSKMAKLKELYDLKRFSVLERSIQKLFKETPINRIGILFAMNGKVDFHFITVVYDQHKDDIEIGGESPYEKFPVDTKFTEFLKELEYKQFIWRTRPFNVGSISDYMEMEGMYDCGWAHIERMILDEHNDLLVYLAITSDVELKPVQRRKAEVFVKGEMLPELIEILEVPNERK